MIRLEKGKDIYCACLLMFFVFGNFPDGDLQWKWPTAVDHG